MSVYMTEEEQIEAIKKWWQRHSKVITLFLSLLLLSISAYKYWFWHQEKIATKASNAYERLMLGSSNEDNTSVKAYADELINAYGKTIYADAANLTLAKVQVATNEYDKAIKTLELISQEAHLPAFKQVAKMRLARLFLAQKNYDKALSILNTLEDESYLPMVNELKGDVYAAMGKNQEAMSAYKKAMSDTRTQSMANLYLEMKTTELSKALPQAPKIATNPVKKT